MSASSLLEQVQAQPACLGHCVSRDGARLGPGRGGASRGLGFRPEAGRALRLPVWPALPAPPRTSAAGWPRRAAPRSLPTAARASLPRFLLLPSCRWRPGPGDPAAQRVSPPPPHHASPQACSLSSPPSSGPALISLFPLSVFFPDDLLLGDVPSSRRDLKVKETKVSRGPPVAAGRAWGGGGTPDGGGGVSGTRPGERTFPKPLGSQVPRAGRSTLLVCSCSWRAAFSLTTSNS